MFRNLKIRTKIVLIVLIAVILSFSVNVAHTYMQMGNMLAYLFNSGVDLGLKNSSEISDAFMNQAKRNLQNMAHQRVKDIEDNFGQIKKDVELVVDFLELSYKSSTNANNAYQHRLKRVSAAKDSIASDTPSVKYDLAPGVSMNREIANELQKISELDYLLYALLKENKIFDNIYIETESGISYTISKFNSYPQTDLRQEEWYKKATETKDESVWIDTHTDTHGLIVTTCVMAFHNPNGKVAGAVAIDVKHSEIIELMLDSLLVDGNFEFLLDKNGNYIGRENISNISDVWRNVQYMISTGEYQNRVVTLDSKDYYLFSSQIESNGWLYGLITPTKSVSSPVDKVKIKIATQIEQTKQKDKIVFSEILKYFFIIFVFTAILSILIAIILSKSITKPLKRLMLQVNSIDKRNTPKIELVGSDEFGDLSRTFNKMSDNLKNYIRELENANTQAEYMNNELEIAHRIQNDLLPKIDTDFHDMRIIDFYAKMVPAEEIGGDFYDFFHIDNGTRICFLVADVSGKGIPAAIYMAQAKMLIKTSIQQTKKLDVAMKNVNKVLSENNESCMFVTVLALSIDLETKECIIVNCGHNKPFISRNGKPYEIFKTENEIAIGMSEESEYVEEKIKLSSNDRIYLYTDGATEAMNTKSEFFGTNRLLKCANDNLSAKPSDLDAAIRAEITSFTQDMPQSDDTTTLAIQIM